MEIKDRIIEFLKNENISSANFAQEIGVQPSAISHIISGRNKPSLDFIVKMLNRYPYLSTEWLLFGKGQMLNEHIEGGLFTRDPKPGSPASKTNDLFDMTGMNDNKPFKNNLKEDDSAGLPGPTSSDRVRKASRIVIFYLDDTFTEYFPE
jgi:transcriptional regulator with XRE-family HTH domain